MKNLNLIISLLCLALALTSCREEKSFRIGVSQCSSDDWRQKMNEEIERELIFHPEATVEIRSADDDAAKQISDLEYFQHEGFDIIIVAPVQEKAITPVISRIYKDGTPVIVFDRGVTGEDFTAKIGVDNYAIGREAARYATRKFPDRLSVFEIEGLEGSTPVRERHEGFTYEISHTPGATLLGSSHGNWDEATTRAIIDSLVSAGTVPDVLYAHNDRMAIWASEQLTRHGRRQDTFIIGIDATPGVGLQAVSDGVIDVSLPYPTEGYSIVRHALTILRGEPYRRTTILPPSTAVDTTNAELLLASNQSIKSETDRIKVLKSQADEYLVKRDAQDMLTLAFLAIIVLLCVVLFLVLRFIWSRRRLQGKLERRNAQLEAERDKQKQLMDQLEEATSAKLSFFTNVSHDLRTPLTLIAEPVQQLAEADNLTPQQSMLMKMAAGNVKILLRMVTQILDFRKFDNGQLRAHLTETPLGAMVLEWTDSFRSMAKKRNIQLSVNVHGCEKKTLAVDTEKVERVFYNLMSNAFKYTPDGGTIHFDYRVDERQMTFTVSDDGVGIARENLERIFQRFYQVEQTRPTGSGIGLALAKAFVELHQGSLTVESQIGVGSVFTVTIPVRHVDEAQSEVVRPLEPAEFLTEPEEDESPETFDPEKPLLLVIDDNRDILTMVRDLMADDYNVITATDGRQGFRKAIKYTPDLIICDVMMPVMDGMECCRRIKEEISTSHIPVLMLTACPLDEQRAEGYDSGADAYMPKPFSGALLKSRCQSLLSNRKRVKASMTAQGPGATRTVKPVPTSDIESEFYRKFCSILETKLSNADLNISDIASEIGLSHSQLYRKIKALTGNSPIELLRSLRVKKARELLAKSEKTVSEIAYEVGFSNPTYLTKCFKDEYGLSPTDFRKSL